MRYSVEILRMAYGKGAIAKLESGKTVFVKGGVPKETVEVEIIDDFENYCTAKIVSRSVKADQIIGADWADLPYETQLLEKKKIVFDALVRNAKFKNNAVEDVLKDVVACQKTWNYRNKIELVYANNSLGMNVGQTNKFCKINSFPLAVKEIKDAPKALTGALKFAQHGQSYGLFRAGIRHSEITNQTQVALWTTPSYFPRKDVTKVITDAIDATSVVRIIADAGKTRKIKKVEILSGSPTWCEVLNNYKFRVSAPSFFQVNTAQAERLQTTVIDSLACANAKRVADLYCGVGTFTLPLAKDRFDITAVELAGSSINDLKRNLDKTNLQANIICNEVQRALPKMEKFDACVVDPPKCGLNKKVIDALLDKEPKTIVYVSCDPMTLARDLKMLSFKGYNLTSITPIDMFPQTHHIETVSLLSL